MAFNALIGLWKSKLARVLREAWQGNEQELIYGAQSHSSRHNRGDARAASAGVDRRPHRYGDLAVSNIRIKDEGVKHEVFGLVQAVLGFVILGLVLLGIGGTIYKVISPEGWVAQAFGRSFSAGAASLGSLLMIVALAWFSRGWSFPRHRSQLSDAVVYGFAIAGLAYIAQLWTKGTF
jgi:hypothetical protein